MNVQTLLNTVEFKDVERDILVTYPRLKDKIPAFSQYFSELQQVTLLSEENHTKIQVSREYYDYAFLVDTETGEQINSFTSFVPVQQILASEVDDIDIRDLSNELIVSTILCLLTNEGSVFGEDARSQQLIQPQSDMEDVIA